MTKEDHRVLCLDSSNAMKQYSVPMIVTTYDMQLATFLASTISHHSYPL